MAKKNTEVIAVEPLAYDKLKADILTRFGLPFAQEVYRHRVECARINAERNVVLWDLPNCEIVEDAITITDQLYSYLIGKN
jgi:hypothetical protein